jgi:hypothetical protein
MKLLVLNLCFLFLSGESHNSNHNQQSHFKEQCFPVFHQRTFLRTVCIRVSALYVHIYLVNFKLSTFLFLPVKNITQALWLSLKSNPCIFCYKKISPSFHSRKLSTIHEIFLCFNRRELPTTFIELRAIAISASTGCIQPITATGIITTL